MAQRTCKFTVLYYCRYLDMRGTQTAHRSEWLSRFLLLMGVDLGAYRTILTTVIVIFSIKFALVDAFSIRDVITVKSSGKRTAATENEIGIVYFRYFYDIRFGQNFY